MAEVGSKPHLSPEELALTQKVVEAVCPLETQVLGPTTVEHIIAGAEFKPVQGGRHFDLALAIALVSCASSLAQLAIKITEVLRSGKATDAEQRTIVKNRVRAAMFGQLAQHPESEGVISKNPLLPERILDVVISIPVNGAS